MWGVHLVARYKCISEDKVSHFCMVAKQAESWRKQGDEASSTAVSSTRSYGTLPSDYTRRANEPILVAAPPYIPPLYPALYRSTSAPPHTTP